MTSAEIVKKFWSLMQSNNFAAVGEVLSDDFVVEWPQSRERIRGRENFATMNSEYPSNGPWQFVINRILANGNDAVSDVSITDGVQKARVISFFTTSDNLIQSMVEFWPDPFPPEQNRRHLVEIFDE